VLVCLPNDTVRSSLSSLNTKVLFLGIYWSFWVLFWGYLTISIVSCQTLQTLIRGGAICSRYSLFEKFHQLTTNRSKVYQELILTLPIATIIPYANSLDPNPSCSTLGQYFHQL